MNYHHAKKVSLALGVASVATSMGSVAVQAGPALQTLNNLTNTAEFSINNTYGQSFSVDGIIGTGASVTPFATSASTAVMGAFNAGAATLTTGFSGVGMGNSLTPVTGVVAAAVISTFATAVSIVLNSSTAVGGLGSLVLNGTTATITIGASISSTLFGPSTVKATTSFTNQLINDLSAF